MNEQITLYLLEIKIVLENKEDRIVYKFGRTGGIYKVPVNSVKTRSDQKRYMFKKRNITSRIKELQRDICKGFYGDIKIQNASVKCVKHKHFRNRKNADFCEKKILEETKHFYQKNLKKHNGGHFTEVRELISKREALDFFKRV